MSTHHRRRATQAEAEHVAQVPSVSDHAAEVQTLYGGDGRKSHGELSVLIQHVQLNASDRKQVIGRQRIGTRQTDLISS